MNDDQKKKELEAIRQCINAEYQTVQKLIFRTIYHAKAIGDKLLYVKWNLLKHGEYEDWVEDNFNGGLSTARAYTRIARQDNWAKIARKLTETDMTIEEALSLIRPRGPDVKPDKRRENQIRELVNRFARLVQDWPDRVLGRLAYDLSFMDLIESAARKRNAELRRFRAQQEKEPLRNGPPLYRFPPELRKEVMKKVKQGKHLTKAEQEIRIGAAFFDPKSITRSWSDVAPEVSQWRKDQKKKAPGRIRKEHHVTELN